jgi:hypothetical protein
MVGTPTAAAKWVIPESFPTYRLAVAIQHAKSYRFSNCTAPGQCCSGLTQKRTGSGACSASSAKRSQFFFRAAGERVDGNEAGVRAGALDPRHRPHRSTDLPHVEVGGVQIGFVRKSVQESDRVPGNRVAELRLVRPVPGDDIVKPGERVDAGRVGVNARGNDGPGPVRKTDERHVLSGGPDLRVVGFQELERGQRHYAIADRARSDEKSSNCGCPAAASIRCCPGGGTRDRRKPDS